MTQSNFPPANYTSKPPFNPAKYYCPVCGEVIWSRYPGHWKSCGCGECYVDMTREYGRVGGPAIFLEAGKDD